MPRLLHEVSESYQLAKQGHRKLQLRTNQLKQQLVDTGSESAMRMFLAFLDAEGHAAINMSMYDCLQMLKSGEWLSIYETVQKQTGLEGEALEQEVRLRLQVKGCDWYERSKKIEAVFKFTHYTGSLHRVVESDAWHDIFISNRI